MTRELRVSTSPTGQPPPEAIVVGFYAHLNESLMACLTLDAEPLGGIVYQSNNGQWEHIADQELLGFQGSGPAGPLPPAVAGLIRFRPIDPKSTARGRTYVPFPSEAFNDGEGKPTQAYLNLLSQLAALYTVNVGISATGPVGPFDPKLLDVRPVLRPWGAATMVLTASTAPGWGTQRRRADPTRFQSPFG